MENLVSENREKFHLGLFLFIIALILIGPFCLFTGIDFMRNAVEGSIEYTCFGCGVPLTRAGSLGMRSTGLLLFLVSVPITYIGLNLFWSVYLSKFFTK